jgi:hypothetical protein
MPENFAGLGMGTRSSFLKELDIREDDVVFLNFVKL